MECNIFLDFSVGVNASGESKYCYVKNNSINSPLSLNRYIQFHQQYQSLCLSLLPPFPPPPLTTLTEFLDDLITAVL